MVLTVELNVSNSEEQPAVDLSRLCLRVAAEDLEGGYLKRQAAKAIQNLQRLIMVHVRR